MRASTFLIAGTVGMLLTLVTHAEPTDRKSVV